MTVIFHDHDAEPTAIAGLRIAIVGYGEDGAAWARVLRDGGHEVVVCTRPGPSAEHAAVDGFVPRPIAAAADADVICLLVPDGVVATLPLEPPGWALTVVTSGAPLASGAFDPNGDVGIIAPRVRGSELRRRVEQARAYGAAVGVHHDRTGRARMRLLAVAQAIGALRGGAIEMSATQEALLTLAVEETLRPELEAACTAFVQTMLERGIPLEALISELVVAGEAFSAASLLRASAARGATGEDARVGLGAVLRRVADDLISGRFTDEPECHSEEHRRLAGLLARHDISTEDVVIDLRTRLRDVV